MTSQVKPQTLSQKVSSWYSSIDKVKYAYHVAFGWWCATVLAIVSFNAFMDLVFGRYTMEGVTEHFWIGICVVAIVLLGYSMLFARLLCGYACRSAERQVKLANLDIRNLDTLEAAIVELNNDIAAKRIEFGAWIVGGFSLIGLIFILGRDIVEFPNEGYLWTAVYAAGVCAVLLPLCSSIGAESEELNKSRSTLRGHAYDIRKAM